MYTLAVSAGFASFILLHCSSVRATLVPYIRTNTALVGQIPNVTEIATVDGISQLSCAMKCSSESTESCQSFLYNTETGRCNIYDAVHADGPEGTTMEPWNYYTVRSSPSADVIPPDCEALYKDGNTKDGVYTFTIEGGANVTTWCDMTNKGWTVFQRRQDGSVNFTRTWAEYVQGFGDPAGEFWLGLDIIHVLTTRPSRMYIEMKTFVYLTPTTADAQYTTFYVGNATSNYLLYISGFSGDCGDSMAYHNGSMFSTIDADNDQSATANCGAVFKGGWWYSDCVHSNLNGVYHNGRHNTLVYHIRWYQLWGLNYSLKTTVMKLKRLT